MGKDVVKVNLGCGPSGIKGWINYDWGILPLLSKMPWARLILDKIRLLPNDYLVNWAPLKLVDIRKKLPLSDESVDYIYCSHVLEHLEKWETRNILKECMRVLRRDGVLRVVLPDLKKMVKLYSSADIFCREFYGFNKDQKIWSRRFIRAHQWMYDDKSIFEEVKKAGFNDIKIVSGGQGKTPDLEKLDLKIHQNLSLYLEATKF